MHESLRSESDSGEGGAGGRGENPTDRAWKEIVAALTPKMPPHIARNFLGGTGECARDLQLRPDGILVVTCWNMPTARILTRYAAGMAVRFTALTAAQGGP